MRTFVIPLIATLLFLTACQEQQPSENLPEAKHDTATEPQQTKPSERSLADAKDDTALEHAKKHLDTQYVCPMHPKIVSDEPGSCSICGMFLVEKEEVKE
jgi:predicted small lipoprotein YifL